MNLKLKEQMMKIVNNAYRSIFLFLLMWIPPYMYSENAKIGTELIENQVITPQMLTKDDIIDFTSRMCKKRKTLSYYLYTEDFIKSFIEIPTSNVLADSSTISSKYLAGRAPLYNSKGKKVGICSASFLCMQNEEGIFTDIANYISVDNGLIVTWFTPTTLINLELDSILNSMVTECIVIASTKVGFNPFYGKKFNMIVSSDQTKIHFKLTRI